MECVVLLYFLLPLQWMATLAASLTEGCGQDNFILEKGHEELERWLVVKSASDSCKGPKLRSQHTC